VAVEVVVLVVGNALGIEWRGQAERVGAGVAQEDAVEPRRLIGGGDRVAQRAVGIADAVVLIEGGRDLEIGGVGKQWQAGEYAAEQRGQFHGSSFRDTAWPPRGRWVERPPPRGGAAAVRGLLELERAEVACRHAIAIAVQRSGEAAL